MENKQDKEDRHAFEKRLKGRVTDEEFNKIMDAYKFAKQGHGYLFQVRDTGERFFEHPRAVAIIIMDEFKLYDFELLQAALLHDIPEDTHAWKVRTIRRFFGNTVGTIVFLVTKPKVEPVFSDKPERDDFCFARLRVHPEERARILKTADRIHNLRSIKLGEKWPVKRIMKYTCETTDKIFPLCDKISGIIFSTKIRDILTQAFNLALEELKKGEEVTV